MEFERQKNTASHIPFPMSDTDANFLSGLTLTVSVWFSDANGVWTSFVPSGIFTEIGITGIYNFAATASDLNHDLVLLVITAEGAVPQAILIRTFRVPMTLTTAYDPAKVALSLSRHNADVNRLIAWLKTKSWA